MLIALLLETGVEAARCRWRIEPVTFSLPRIVWQANEPPVRLADRGPVGHAARRVERAERAQHHGAFVLVATQRRQRDAFGPVRLHALHDRRAQHWMRT